MGQVAFTVALLWQIYSALHLEQRLGVLRPAADYGGRTAAARALMGLPEYRFPPPLEPSRRRTFLRREQVAGSLIVCLRGAMSVADMSSRRRPARMEAQYSPHEETAKHRDLPKQLGQELQAHFKPLRELPHRMLTLLLRLKNIRAPHGERRSAPPAGSAGPAPGEDETQPN